MNRSDVPGSGVVIPVKQNGYVVDGVFYTPEEYARLRRQWRPIETAPKDGTDILLYRNDCGPFLARWIAPCEFLTEDECSAMSDEEIQTQDWFYADFVSGGRVTDGEPTHWMPLPEPPLMAEQQK